MKNCVWKDEIEPLLGTFAIDLSEAGEKTKTDVALKLSKREASIIIYLSRSLKIF